MAQLGKMLALQAWGPRASEPRWEKLMWWHLLIIPVERDGAGQILGHCWPHMLAYLETLGQWETQSQNSYTYTVYLSHIHFRSCFNSVPISVCFPASCLFPHSPQTLITVLCIILNVHTRRKHQVRNWKLLCFLNLRVRMYVFTYAREYMYSCMWRAKDNLRCHLQEHPFETRIHTGWSKSQQSSCLHLLRAGITNTHTLLAFCMDLGAQI